MSDVIADGAPPIPDRAIDIPYGFARKHGVVMLPVEGERLTIAVREGSDPRILLEVRRHLARSFDVLFVEPAQFDRHLSNHYAMEGSAAAMAGSLEVGADELDILAADIPTADDLLDSADDAPAIRLINGIIAEAARQGVSDIHIEPYETGLIVRMRVDGVLRETLRMPPHVAPVVVSRIKVMARLDIAERRVPQDGRIGLTLGGKLLDVRVSTLPSRAGERVVLRILDKENAGITLDLLGMTGTPDRIFREGLGEPNGIILVTGPTGSGKTTTLYAGLRQLNDGSRNILTVEDPVEYAMEGVGQTQVNAKVGLTFAAGLRAILRQDPDVVMIGEIRDRETAEIAVQASLTGHLVLSTVHTNDAVGCDHPHARHEGRAVPARLDAARGDCATAGAAAVPERADEPVPRGGQVGQRPCSASTPACDRLPRRVGCDECGRHRLFGAAIGVFEAIRVDDTRPAHDQRRRATRIADRAIMRSLKGDQSGVQAARRAGASRGQTTAEEAVRVSRAMDEPAVAAE